MSLFSLALLLSASLAAAGYRRYGGFVPAGYDVSAPLPAGTTVAAGEAACTALAACAAITYVGSASAATGAIFLKNSSGLDEFVANATSEWSTQVKVVGPCDIYAAAGSPCVAAHSLTRALFGAYGGRLYQVNRSTDSAVLDVAVRSEGGTADAAAQDAFCAGAACAVTKIYDQSPRGNDLGLGPPGGAYPVQDRPVNASRFPLAIAGAAAYAAYFEGRMGYRIDVTDGVARGNDEETLYMVTSGQHYNDECCFDCERHAARRLPAGSARAVADRRLSLPPPPLSRQTATPKPTTMTTDRRRWRQYIGETIKSGARGLVRGRGCWRISKMDCGPAQIASIPATCR
jgi:hypothetical protein